nr:MAG TPA: hypothetical protein [Caudoviricetes sp.]
MKPRPRGFVALRESQSDILLRKSRRRHEQKD